MLNDANGILTWVAALLAGGALGTFFFAGLYWTVRRAAASQTPARWFFASMVGRSATVLAGFYAIGADRPLQWGLCLLGFLLARSLVLRLTRPVPATASALGAPPCA